jgi:hypothetical protein
MKLGHFFCYGFSWLGPNLKILVELDVKKAGFFFNLDHKLHIFKRTTLDWGLLIVIQSIRSFLCVLCYSTCMAI